MDLEQSVIRRLAFIKYLFRVAVNQSEAPEPLSSASVLTFHDAIELFLQFASEHLDAGAVQPKFMDYWELLSKKLPEGKLTHKEAMRRLNKARVALKHHGTLPSKLDVEAFRASATNFFEVADLRAHVASLSRYLPSSLTHRGGESKGAYRWSIRTRVRKARKR